MIETPPVGANWVLPAIPETELEGTGTENGSLRASAPAQHLIGSLGLAWRGRLFLASRRGVIRRAGQRFQIAPLEDGIEFAL